MWYVRPPVTICRGPVERVPSHLTLLLLLLMGAGGGNNVVCAAVRLPAMAVDQRQERYARSAYPPARHLPYHASLVVGRVASRRGLRDT
jgi:hypothetical protein